MTCVYCASSLDSTAARPAFDPWLGRLWRVCPECGRWNVVPLEARWEELESLERAVRDDGRSLLRTAHLDLVRTPAGEIIRVGRAPRPELAGWRYGDAVPPAVRRGLRAWLHRILLGMPTSPHGYDTSEIGSINYPFDATRWFASPFLDDAPALAALFASLPLAGACPACGVPLVIAPWAFEKVRLIGSGAGPMVEARCASCRRDAAVPLGAVRPVLRLGLALVNRRLRHERIAEPAASAIDRADGPSGLTRRLARRDATLGELGPELRMAFQMALDEAAEAELLEAEWSEAEELAEIIDGELTPMPALDDLRRSLPRPES